MTGQIDADFLALPLETLADAALQHARTAGGAALQHADLRVQRMRTGSMHLRDARLSSSSDVVSAGLAVRVLLDGVWGFAATDELTPAAAVATAGRALEVARISRPLMAERVELAPEPVHTATWVSSYETDPFDVPVADRARHLAAWSSQLLAADGVDHCDAMVNLAKEQKFYADLAGTVTRQQRVLIEPEITVVAIAADGPESMRTLAPPVARGWEYLNGTGWDWTTEIASLPGLLAERVAAPTVTAGDYDLVIDPTNLWLTIHESVGHATELDRSLGYEAAYAGTSFATLEGVGSFRYGSELMNVTADRTVEHGGATTGFDDEGVATRSWDLVSKGVLAGFQLDRAMAARCGLPASNGCAYADSALNVPVQRMANVSLAASSQDVSTDDLISGVDDGLYVVGDKSWSIDMQRYNFQFTAQRFYRIRGGRLAGQVKDAAYQGSTPSFWGSLTGLGGSSSSYLGGASNCGKAQPGQSAWVSHGAPATLFEQVKVLNTRSEGGR
ncbi:TldD/PmbA family protein [Kineosporia succinea]|uniref:TldD protein n=1 Tax=Kineosporia succinea TaxID=84632 RepID=A0ABT9P7B5_9ACTN|nr:TldD/PmbA family protein [Kineosporia succinea]MDP9828589.1 TldD protein [Kineosporia succinea]